MGTRNLTMVVSKGKTKVAQYGQWDGYPSGQGSTALKFLKNISLDAFKKRMETVRFSTKKDHKAKEDFFKTIGAADGWMTMEQSELYKTAFPLDSRDFGADILSKIMDSDLPKVTLDNNEIFAADSLFCEWAYVIDLDKNTFEVYQGFNKTPLTETDRFFKLQKKNTKEYFPVKLLASFPLDKLPTTKKFLAIDKDDEEETA